MACEGAPRRSHTKRASASWNDVDYERVHPGLLPAE